MKKPTLIIGADHAGFALKEKLVHELCKRGYVIEDMTPTFIDGDDYPPIGKDVAQLISSKKDVRGLLICGSGTGMVIAANRIKGARAALGHNVKEIEKARIDNDINILCLSGWNEKISNAVTLIDTFIKTKTSKSARHARRVKELDA